MAIAAFLFALRGLIVALPIHGEVEVCGLPPIARKKRWMGHPHL
jgi:hypothetical protein